MTNRLKHEKSPYLLQHGENPVEWYPWCEEAFRKATQEDKPVFLSIGYSTCHWCHVMAHESFEDEEVAAILNRDFISIKVDREERPDVDSVYMSVCQAMNGFGGWPLTVLMAPEQKPFFAATYLPKHSNFRQFGLVELLERTAFLWKNNRDELIDAGNTITKALQERKNSEKGVPSQKILHQAYQMFCEQFDRQWGGFGAPPKFPTPHNLLFLMHYGQMEQKQDALEMAESTLKAMARGGIHDQIGGGFSRYSTDTMWLVPHFEKMLYDNALLILAYLKAYQIAGKAQYADTVRRTADYVLRELTDSEGGFFCGQDADSDGVEGKYYIFTPEEVSSVLGERDGMEFCRLYGITPAGNFEGKSIPNRIGQTEPGWDREDVRLKKLYEYRLTRAKLHKDDKVLLFWNAWMIMALARAGQILAETHYLNAAVKAYNFIKENMTDNQGHLYLCYRDGEAAHAGQLDDYATFALSALELYGATFEPEYLREAIQMAKRMIERFTDWEYGGYFMTAENAETLIMRPKETYDGAIPSGNSVAAMVLQTLASLTGESMWQEASNQQLEFLAADFARYPLGYCFGGLAMMDALYPNKELICASRAGLPEELAAYLKKSNNLHVMLKTEKNADALAQCAPFTKDYPVPEQGAMYYLCENGACKRPVRSFAELNL